MLRKGEGRGQRGLVGWRETRAIDIGFELGSGTANWGTRSTRDGQEPAFLLFPSSKIEQSGYHIVQMLHRTRYWKNSNVDAGCSLVAGKEAVAVGTKPTPSLIAGIQGCHRSHFDCSR